MRFSYYLLGTLILLRSALGGHCQSTARSTSAEQHLTLRADLVAATLREGQVTIPFRIENKSDDTVVVRATRRHIDLMANNRVNQPELLGVVERTSFFWSGPTPEEMELKPGDKMTLDAICPMETLALSARRKHKVFGAISGRTSKAGQNFTVYSDPIDLPSRLTENPWADLGKQNYLRITADTTAVSLDSAAGDALLFSIKVSNSGTGSYIAAIKSMSFTVVHENRKFASPSPWASISAVKPVLEPGESVATASGECYVTPNFLRSQGFKKGDKIVAAVGGRVPNTNQIFECYSEPFELPALTNSPEDKPK